MDYCPVCGSAMTCTCKGKGVPAKPRDCCLSCGIPGWEAKQLINGLCEQCYFATVSPKAAG